jgi:hypothetical protein
MDGSRTPEHQRCHIKNKSQQKIRRQQKKPRISSAQTAYRKNKQWTKIKQAVLEQYKLPMSVGQIGNSTDIS